MTRELEYGGIIQILSGIAVFCTMNMNGRLKLVCSMQQGTPQRNTDANRNTHTHTHVYQVFLSDLFCIVIVRAQTWKYVR